MDSLTNQKSPKNKVVGIGSALVDILIYESDEFLKKTGAAKGGMKLVDNEFIENTLIMLKDKPCIVPGGSACNTVTGIGRLGGRAGFVGKRGNDEMGVFYENEMRSNNVEPILFTSDSPTGRVLSIITPDAQRSMFTFLGASSETAPEEITEKCFSDAMIVHIEGYLLFNKDLMIAALDSAKKAGARISLDLASYTVVEDSKNFIENNVCEFVDILIANEDEARVFTGCDDEIKALKKLSKKAPVAIVKIGERGSYIACEEDIISIKPHGSGGIIDTTGAGDLWASGFLYSLVCGYPIEKCGKIGSACGYEVCRVVGANIPDDGWERIKTLLK